MTKWDRAPVDMLCGLCSSHIHSNAPILLIQLPNVKRLRVRGECCAGHAPPDLAPSVARPTTRAMTPIKKTAAKFGGKIWKHG